MKDLDKILLLLRADKKDPRVMKHLGALTDCSYEEAFQIYDYCLSKGIELNDPKTWVVFGNSFSYVKSKVTEYENINELAAIIEKPERINPKGAVERLQQLQKAEEPYKTPEGKYSNLPFSKKRFESKYAFGVSPEVVPVVNEVKPAEEIQSPVVQSENITSPVVETFVNNPTMVAKDEPVAYSEADIYYEILSKPLTMALSDDKFATYLDISDYIRQVIFALNGNENVPDELFMNLQKLMQANVEDLHDLIYYSIVYKKNLPEAVTNRLEEKINECIADIEYNKGRMSV